MNRGIHYFPILRREHQLNSKHPVSWLGFTASPRLPGPAPSSFCRPHRIFPLKGFTRNGRNLATCQASGLNVGSLPHTVARPRRLHTGFPQCLRYFIFVRLSYSTCFTKILPVRIYFYCYHFPIRSRRACIIRPAPVQTYC